MILSFICYRDFPFRIKLYKQMLFPNSYLRILLVIYLEKEKNKFKASIFSLVSI